MSRRALLFPTGVYGARLCWIAPCPAGIQPGKPPDPAAEVAGLPLNGRCMELKELMLAIGRRAYLEYRCGCWGLNKRFRKSVTAVTKQGKFTVLTADDAIGKVLYARKQYELELMTKATALLRSLGQCSSRGQGTIVDIGANNGVIAVGMLYTGQFARAIAVEPEPRNFSLL